MISFRLSSLHPLPSHRDSRGETALKYLKLESQSIKLFVKKVYFSSEPGNTTRGYPIKQPVTLTCSASQGEGGCLLH